MMNINIDYLCKAVEGELINGDGKAVISGVSTDSRTTNPGQVYFALQGEKHDGHNFARQAFSRGAAIAVVEKVINVFSNQPLIMVNDTTRALQLFAKAYRSRFNIPVIAVTGSVGKTTTKEILAQCLADAFTTLKTKGNFNNDIGLPLTLLSLQESHQIAVVELGMRASGEIKRLAELAMPTAAIITNVEPVHLETLHTLENIARAKCEVLSVLSNKDFAVINGDSEVLLQAAQEYDCVKYTFGFNEFCDFRILNVTLNHNTMEIKANFYGQEEVILFPLPAAKLAPNVIAAAAVCFLTGLELQKIKASLKNYKTSGNRLNIINLNAGGFLINDTYNANPVSMCAALEVGSELHQKGKFIAILGDMLELGDYEKEGHLLVGRKAAETETDLLITIGDRSVIIAEGAKLAGMSADKIFSFTDKEAATTFIRQEVNQQDTILVKASRGMELETIIQKLDF